MPRLDREEGYFDDRPRKKKDPLGKLQELFTPKSYRIHAAMLTGTLFAATLAFAITAPFVGEYWPYLLAAAGAMLFATLIGGLSIIFLGPGSDRVEIRQEGVRFHMKRDIISLGWSEIEYMDSHTEHHRYLNSRENRSTYQAYLSTAQGHIELSAKFLKQFDDPARILKLIRKGTGATLRYLELPTSDESASRRKKS